MVVLFDFYRFLIVVIVVGDMIERTISLLCYSNFFKQQYEECNTGDYCFFLEDYSMLNPTDTQNHTRGCERKGHCKTLIENLNGRIMMKYGLRHKCGTFMITDRSYSDLCCCNYDWCNKLKVNELPIITMDDKNGCQNLKKKREEVNIATL
ncbi:Bone morphogenetic protein receptor type-1B [Dirofilaria immitis]